MVSLSVIKVKIPNAKYLMSRADLDFVREQLTAAKADSTAATKENLDSVLGGKHKLPNGTAYTLKLAAVTIDPALFYVYSTRHCLNQATTARLINLVRCAITASNTLLVFPDYIVISTTPEPVKKRSTKNGDGK